MQLFSISSRKVAFGALCRIFWFPMILMPMIVADNLHRGLNISALLPQTHECRIDSDPGEPRRETGSFLEFPHVQERFHELLLKYVLCILPILYDLICPAQDLVGMS